MQPHQDIETYFADLADQLRAAGRHENHYLSQRDFHLFRWPWSWRKGEDNEIEHLIRHARSVGIHASYEVVTGGLRCRLTRDAADEATITWPSIP